MVVDKVTKDMLMKLNVNDQKVFTLPSPNLARSAQSYAHQFKKQTMGTKNQREFKAVIGDPNPDNGQTGVTITRLV